VYTIPVIKAIVDLNLVPYGNTRVSGDVFTCQHGADECRTDLFGLCLLDRLGGIGSTIASEAAYDFFVCMESADGAPSSAPGCFDSTLGPKVEFTWEQDILAKCADDPTQSIVVQHAGADATPADHQFVPWVVIDGSMVDNPDPLLELICTAYTGPLPDECWPVVQKANELRKHFGLSQSAPLPHWALPTRLQTCAAE